MADGVGEFIFQTNIKQVQEEIRSGLTAITQASNIPQSKAGQNLLSGISGDVRRETEQLAKDVRNYQRQLEQLQRAGTPLGDRQTLAQFANDRVQQARTTIRTAAVNRTTGSGIPSADVAQLVTEMERGVLNRATNDIRARVRASATGPSAGYAGQPGDIRDNPSARSINQNITRALQQQETAAQQAAQSAEQAARSAASQANDAGRAARAQADNARATEQLAEANQKAARQASASGAAGGGGRPPRPPTPGSAPPPEEEPRPNIIQGGSTDEAVRRLRQAAENEIARRIADPSDPLRAISASRAYDPTSGAFYRRRLSEAQPEAQLTRPVDIQNAQEQLARVMAREAAARDAAAKQTQQLTQRQAADAQRATLESRLLQGDRTVSEVPRRGLFGGGYIDRADPNNPIFTERQRGGTLAALDPAADQTKIAQALASEAEASSKAAQATLRRAKAEQNAESALEKRVQGYGQGGVVSSFTRGFFSGGFGGQGEPASLDAFAKSAGTALKYSTIYQTIGLVQQAAGAAVQQLLDMNDSITQLQVAMNTADQPAKEFQNDLQDIAAQGGFNVGEAMDTAAAGIRAFKDQATQAGITTEQLGTGFARQAQRIAVLSNTTLKDAAGNLQAATSGFGLTPNEAGFRRITDAIAGGKLAGGGQEQDLSQFLASSAETFNQAGFNPEEASSIGSKVISSLDETGTLAATRLSRLFSILQGSSGKNYLRDLNAQIGSLNQTRGAKDQITPIDTSASARDQVLQLAAAYKDLSAQQQQVLLTRIGGTGQSRELKVLLETVQTQVAKASGGFDDKGLQQYQRTLDNIRNRLNQIKGDVIAIVTNLAGSGLLAPFEAALAVVQPLVRMVRELTQALTWLEGFGPFRWVEEIGIGLVALRGAMTLIRSVQQQGVAGVFGLAEARIAPGRALSRQRLQEVQQATEVGGYLAARHVAGGGRYDVAVGNATSDLEKAARVTGKVQDNLLGVRNQRAVLVEQQSQVPQNDAAWGAMQRQIEQLDRVIANRTASLARLTATLGRERVDLEQAIQRQGLAAGVNQRYDRSDETLTRRRDQALADVAAREARDQRRVSRVGGDVQDFSADRERINQQYAATAARLTAQRTADLEGVASRDLNAPTGILATRQRLRTGIRDVGESIVDRGYLGTIQAGRAALPGSPTVWEGVKISAKAASDGLKGLPTAARAIQTDFERLRSQGVNPLMAALRAPGGALTGTGAYQRANGAFQGFLGGLNGRDPEDPLARTRTQRIKGVLGSEIGVVGGALIGVDLVTQIKGTFDQIGAAAAAGHAAAGVDVVGASAEDLKNSANALNAAASNLDEATSGFFGSLTDAFLNSGQGAQQSQDLREMANFREAAASRLDTLRTGAAQSGQGNRYVDAIDNSSADNLTVSLQQLTDAGVPASERVKALAASIDQLNAAAAGGRLTPAEREQLTSGAGEAAGTALGALKNQFQVPFAGGLSNAVGKYTGTQWLMEHTFLGNMATHSDGQTPNQETADLQHRLALQGVSVTDVQGDARFAATQSIAKGADLSTKDGQKIFSDAYSALLAKYIPKPEDRAKIVSAVVADLAQKSKDLGIDSPYATGIGEVQNAITQGQANQQQTALEDQAKALSSGKDFDGGVHATQVMLDFWKSQRERIKKLMQHLGATSDEINTILGLLDQQVLQGTVDLSQKLQQDAQLQIQRAQQRQQHDLQNITNPNAIEARRNRDSQSNLQTALGVGDVNTAAQLLGAMTPDQIKAAGDAIRNQIQQTKKQLGTGEGAFGPGTFAPTTTSPHLRHLEHQGSLLTQAYGLSAPQYTAGDIAAAQQAAQAATSGSQAASDAANVATAQQGVLDAERQYDRNSKQVWDARAQLNAAQRQQATDSVERAIEQRNIMADTGSQLDAANRAIQDAADRATAAAQRGDADEVKRQNALKTVAELQRASALRELQFLQERARIDITNPALLAAQEAKEAQQRAEDARRDPRTAADHQAQLDASAREARNNSEKVAHDQWLSDLQEKDKLGDISHRAYIQSLEADIARLRSIKKLTYQQQQMLNADRDALQAAQSQLSGQFNLGNITLPSVYEVRRSVKAQVDAATAAAIGGGAPGTVVAPQLSAQPAGSLYTQTAADNVKATAAAVTNYHNNVTVNGADFTRVVDYLNKVFGKTARITTTPRKA